jgi:putative ABC transport system permease protein
MRLQRWLLTVPLRLRSLLRRSAVERDLADEIEDYLERGTAAGMATGLSREDARAAALRAFGGLEPRKEECRDARRVALIEHLVQDVRYAFRVLRASPSFTGVAVVSLALGIGANTTIFQLLNALRLRPLPVSRPHELVAVQIHDRGWPPSNYSSRYADLTYPLWERIRDRQQAFAGTAAWSHSTFDLAATGESRFVENGLWVSGDFFNLLGVKPALGRLFTAADDVRGCGAPGVVLSYDFWRREYGGLRSVVGSTISVGHRPFAIIGVSAPGFYGVEIGRSFDLALPLCAEAIVNAARNRLDAPSRWWLAVMGRLAPGVTRAQASAHLAAISRGIFAETIPPRYTADDAGKYAAFTLEALPAESGYSKLRAEYNLPLWMLLGLAATVLLVACANLANLMLARLGGRSREMAVRLSLGASRGRVVRQLLTESLVLSAIGTGIGLWLAGVLGSGIVSLISSDVDPMFVDLALDWRILGFTAALACLTCMLFGLAPALRATHVAPGEAMKVGGRTLTSGRAQSRLRRLLVASQLALSLVLLVGGLLFGRSLAYVLRIDAGFQQVGILEADVDLTHPSLTDDGLKAIQQTLLDTVRALPGVEAAATATNVPLVGNWYDLVFVNGAQGRVKRFVNFNRVSTGYFETLRTPIVAGRDFDERDRTGAPVVAVVNERFAQLFLGGTVGVGTSFQIEGAPGEPGPAVRIIGIVRNAKYGSLREEFRPIVYVAESQNEQVSRSCQILMRTRGPLAPAMAAVKQAIEGTNGDISFHFHDFQEQIRYSLKQDQLMATLCGFFALLGAILATLGVYGVSSYTVSQRSSEIGLRLTLGATSRTIVRLILAEAAVPVGIGLAIGCALSLVSMRTAAALLYGLAPTDAPTLTGAVILLGAVALAASYVPARRAAKVDPMVALRCE